MKLIRLNHKLSVRSLFFILVLMFSGFFGQCVMTVEMLSMDHNASVHSEDKECDGVCNIYDSAHKEEFVLLKDPPESKLIAIEFSQKSEKISPSHHNKRIGQIKYLSYLPPGTVSEGIKLRI